MRKFGLRDYAEKKMRNIKLRDLYFQAKVKGNNLRRFA